MKNFLLKLLSNKYNVLRTSKQTIDIHNEKQKEKENQSIIPDLIQDLKSLPMSNEQTFDYFITKNHQIHKQNFPLKHSTFQIIQLLSNKQNGNYHKNLCCRRKTKIIHYNDVIHNQQSFRTIKQKSHNLNTDNETHNIDHYPNIRAHKQFSDNHFHYNNDQNQTQKSPRYSSLSQTTAIAINNSSKDPTSSKKDQQEFSVSFSETKSDTKQLYNELNIRELVNIVRTEIGALIDADESKSSSSSKSFNHNFPNNPNNQNTNISATKAKQKKNSKTSMKTKTNKKKSSRSKTSKSSKSHKRNQINSIKNIKSKTSSKHDSLRQIMRDAEQMKQFALNTAMIGIDPLKLKDLNNALSPAICIPMYNCENIRDQRFPMGPTFTTISKNDMHNNAEDNRKTSMIIQSINTQRGKIQIKLDPQSFGLAPFFSDQYETFIKGPPNSIFFSNYINTFNK